MKLKAKMIALSLIPSVVLGIILFFVAATRIADSVYDEAYVGMEATALAVRDIAVAVFRGFFVFICNLLHTLYVLKAKEVTNT